MSEPNDPVLTELRASVRSPDAPLPEPTEWKPTVPVTLIIIGLFAAFDFSLVPLLDNIIRTAPWIVGLLVGALMAEGALIAIFGIFSPINIAVRLPLSLLMGTIMFCLFFAGGCVTAARGAPPPHEVLEMAAALLLSLALGEAALGLLKKLVRLRLLQPGEAGKPVNAERLQFQIRHLLIGTFLVALSLSLLRVLAPDMEQGNVMTDIRAWIAVAVLWGIVFVATVPVFFCAFAPRPAAALLLAGAFYALFIAIGELAVIAVMEPRAPEMAEILGVLFTLNLSQVVIVFAAMRIYRALGFRLARVPRRPALAAAE